MQFLYPYFLWALLSLAIPIVIHLFYFRQFRTVYFTNVRLLQELKEENSSRSRLRNIIVLILRCLALVGLVLAFAQPFLPARNGATRAGRRAVAVFVDNSFSMSANDADVPLLEKAKQRAREIVVAHSSDDEFQILTQDFEGRDQRLLSQADALKRIDDVKPSPASQDLPRIIARTRQTLRSSTATVRNTYVVSDFQRATTFPESPPAADTSVHVTLVPLQSVERRNVAIDSCWLESPVPMLNETNRLVVRLHNYATAPVADIRLTLTHNGQVKPVGNTSLGANEVKTDTVPVTILQAGWNRLEVGITDFPIQFDDRYYLAFKVTSKVRILAIDEGAANSYLDAIFRNTPYFEVTHASAARIDYARLRDYNLVILNGVRQFSTGLTSELQNYTKSGGNVLLFPAASIDAASYNAFASSFGASGFGQFDKSRRAVAYINTDDFVFNDVYLNAQAGVNNNLHLPETVGNFVLTRGSTEEVLLRYRDGGTFVGKYKQEAGNLYLCAAPLDVQYNNLVKSAEVFVPMVFKMALATGTTPRLSYTLGRDNTIEADRLGSTANANATNGNKAVFKLQLLEGKGEEMIPEQRNIGARTVFNLNGSLREAGFYSLFLSKRDSAMRVWAFNYDRKESDLNYLSEPQLAKLAGTRLSVLTPNASTNFVELVGEQTRGVPLWKWCIIAALIFLLAEIAVIRLFKQR